MLLGMTLCPQRHGTHSPCRVYTHPLPAVCLVLHRSTASGQHTLPQAPRFPHQPEERQWEGREYAPGVRAAEPAWGHKKKYKVLRNNFSGLPPLQQSIPIQIYS